MILVIPESGADTRAGTVRWDPVEPSGADASIDPVLTVADGEPGS